VKKGDDELGVLVDRFNEMMAQINARDIALQNAHDELEERVKARTTQLEAEIVERTRIEQDLVAAKETAEESNQAKSAFLANMSHELRTPLNAIIGYAELLEEEAQDAGENGTIADLRKIGASGKHLLTLINDVLDLSKIEAGRMEVCLEPVQIASVMDEVANTRAAGEEKPQQTGAPAERRRRHHVRRSDKVPANPAEPAQQCLQVH
jgi:signal transduction histidine kinase